MNIWDFDSRFFQGRECVLAHGFIVQETEWTEPIPFCFFPSQKEIVGHIQVIGQSQSLKHRFNARFPRLNRAGKIHLCAIEHHGTARALLHPGDLAHEGGFSSAVVPHDGDMLTFAQFKICAFQRMDPSVVFGQVCRFQNNVFAHFMIS